MHFAVIARRVVTATNHARNRIPGHRSLRNFLLPRIANHTITPFSFFSPRPRTPYIPTEIVAINSPRELFASIVLCKYQLTSSITAAKYKLSEYTDGIFCLN